MVFVFLAIIQSEVSQKDNVTFDVVKGYKH